MSEQTNPAGQPAAPAATAQPTAVDHTDKLMDASYQRQKRQQDGELKSQKDKEGKHTTIVNVVNHVQKQTGSATAHQVWSAIGMGGITPRPASQDEFRSLMVELVHAGKLGVVAGGLEQPLTKIYLRTLEYRIDG